MKNAKLKSMLIAVSIGTLVFTGCGSRSQNSKNYMNDTKSPYTTDNKGNTSNSMSGQNYQTAMKNLYSTTLKQLVTAKTITQTQSNKVLSELTQNMSQGQMGQYNQSDMGKSSKNQPDIDNQYQTGTSDGAPSNNMGLSSLVKSKVITQAQANTIMQKIQAMMKDMKIK